jgi:hypothetical protein
MHVLDLFNKSRRGVSALSQLLQHSHLSGRNAMAPTVFIDLTKPIPIRSMRDLLILFSEGGYPVWLRGKMNRWLLQVGEDLPWHDGTDVAWGSPPPVPNLTLCTDSRRSVDANGFRKVIHLYYDYSPKLRLTDDHFAMPLPMHPQLYVEYDEIENLDVYRANQRRMRILFSGNCDEEGYDQRIFRDVYGKLSRVEIVNAIQTYVWAKRISEGHLSELLEQPDYHRVFFLLHPKTRINQGRWLNTVSRSDFFLCPPGVVFAWSCNLVEAMAVGTIPITNYPEWLFPPLRHGVDALTFSTIPELRDAIYMARRMSDEQIAEMRRNVIAYYESHLAMKPFVRRLMDHPAPIVHLHSWQETEAGAREAYLGTALHKNERSCSV